MPKRINDHAIQLHCTLCPKTPQFSDVSHLLTHISSKSHLSHRFKLQIRAQSERGAKQQLDNFDIWYHNNNLDVLLSGRLAAKEQKKNAKERRAAKARLSDTSVKDELEAAGPGRREISPAFRAPVPRMHLWPTTSTPTTFEWEPPIVYSTPTTRRQLPNFEREETPSNSIASGLLDPQLTTPWKPSQADDEKASEKLSDSNRLKGIYWPGMNLFDSATPEMKRMRNQRKDGSILEQMMTTSAIVEPLEHVYHADGVLRNTRDIFGPLSIENSPENVKIPTPKRRKRRSPRKATFDDISINARMGGNGPKKNIFSGSPQKRQYGSQQCRSPFDGLPYKPQPTPNPLAAFGNRFMTTAEEDEEFQMTVGDITQKRAFGIFQDASEVSPGRTESPLEEPRFDFLNDGMPRYSANIDRASQASPSPLAKPIPMRIFGKENNPPEMVQTENHRGASSSHIYPPQVFYDSSFNPLYNPLSNYSNRPNEYGYPSSYNEDTTTGNGGSSNFHGDFKSLASISRCPSQQGYREGLDDNSESNMDFGM